MMRLFLFALVACGGVCACAAQDRKQLGPVKHEVSPLMLGEWPNLDEKELPQFQPAEKPSPHRLRGMKAALADIEQGLLKQKLPSLTEPDWVKTYVAMLNRILPRVDCEAVEAKEY